MIALVPMVPVVADELTDAELRAAVELLDRHKLESVIRRIYAAGGGLH